MTNSRPFVSHIRSWRFRPSTGARSCSCALLTRSPSASSSSSLACHVRPTRGSSAPSWCAPPRRPPRTIERPAGPCRAAGSSPSSRSRIEEADETLLWLEARGKGGAAVESGGSVATGEGGGRDRQDSGGKPKDDRAPDSTGSQREQYVARSLNRQSQISIVNVALGDIGVRINPPISKEGPVRPNDIDESQVTIDNENFFRLTGFGDYSAIGVADK